MRLASPILRHVVARTLADASRHHHQHHLRQAWKSSSGRLGHQTLRVPFSLPKSALLPRSIVAHVSTTQPARATRRPEKPNEIPRSRAVPFVLASLLAGIIAFYSGQLLVAASKPCTNVHIADLSQQQDVSSRYEYTANTFDSEVGVSEWLMGVLDLRKEFAGKCKGHVLEVSCGTGRNLGYFDALKGGRVDSLTFVDLSPQMLELCKKKWKVLYGRRDKDMKAGLVIRFLTASALDAMPLAPTTPKPKKYDSIIQTMGLCSTPTPVALLENMVEHLDTSNPDARIFLLEHGRSYRDWLNNILDNSAQKHAELHGCWFNRDIGALVAEAAEKCDLEIVLEKRKHIGTTWVFELKPKYVTPDAEPVEVQEPKWTLRKWWNAIYTPASEEQKPSLVARS